MSFQEHIRFRSNDTKMMNIFNTYSLADLHSDEIHQALPDSDQYLGKKIVQNECDKPSGEERGEFLTKKQDFLLRARAVDKNSAFIVDHFCKKVEGYVEQVLQRTIGVDEFVIRYEFQHRGCIHAHCLFSVKYGPSTKDLRIALGKIPPFEEPANSSANPNLEPPEEEDQDMAEPAAPSEQRNFIEAEGRRRRREEEKKQAIKEKQEEIIEFACLQIGLCALHPDLDPKNWPFPYGSNYKEPLVNVLRQPFDEITKDDDSIAQALTRLVNRVQLHSCIPSYCLKEVGTVKKEETVDKTTGKKLDKTGTDEANNKFEQVIGNKRYKCRFGFPLPTVGYEPQVAPGEGAGGDILVAMTNDQTCPSGARFSPKANPVEPSLVSGYNFELNRNHPKLNSTITEQIPFFRANTDAQLILDPEQAMDYITKYTFKAEKSSLSHQKVAKAAVDNLNSDVPMRKLLQKTIMATKDRDIPRQECNLIMSSDHDYVKMSMPTRFCSLTGNKIVAMDQLADETKKLTRDTSIQETYWKRESDINFRTACTHYETDPDGYKSKAHKNYQTVKHPVQTTLHEFVAFHNKDWSMSKVEYIPVFSPKYLQVPKSAMKELHQKHCRARLLQARLLCHCWDSALSIFKFPVN